MALFLFSVGGERDMLSLAFILLLFLRFFIRPKFLGLDYGFTVEEQGMCIIFCLVEISAQTFAFVSRIGLFTESETFFSLCG